MMGQLERRAEAISGEFNSQNVANTLWAFARMGRKPGERMMGQLEQRAEAISGEFNSQEIASTLWAFATMGRKPRERTMELLEGRVEAISGEFNSQEIANTLWAYATMGLKMREQIQGTLQQRAEDIAGDFSSRDICTVFWTLSHHMISIPTSILHQATVMLGYSAIDLKMLAQAVHANPSTTYASQVSIAILIMRVVPSLCAHLTAEDIMFVITCIWESAFFEETIEYMLQILKERWPDTEFDTWATHDICNVKDRCETWGGLTLYRGVVNDFRHALRESEFCTSLFGGRGNAQHFIMNIQATRLNCVGKIVDKVGGLDVIRTQCVCREFNAVLHELKYRGFLDAALRHEVVPGSNNEDALNNCFMTDRQILMHVQEQSLVPTACQQTLASPPTPRPASPKHQGEESNDTVQESVDAACSQPVLPARIGSNDKVLQTALQGRGKRPKDPCPAIGAMPTGVHNKSRTKRSREQISTPIPCPVMEAIPTGRHNKRRAICSQEQISSPGRARGFNERKRQRQNIAKALEREGKKKVINRKRAKDREKREVVKAPRKGKAALSKVGLVKDDREEAKILERVKVFQDNEAKKSAKVTREAERVQQRIEYQLIGAETARIMLQEGTYNIGDMMENG
jgi:hypothetical protein